jgi:hypothetical protein
MLLLAACACLPVSTLDAQPPIVPPSQELNAPFGAADRATFAEPSAVYRPETWFHFISRNISKEGITADLEAIAAAGISGIQFFHGQFGGQWPQVDNQIVYFSPQWDDAVRHTAQECRRLGLRFTMQNCPGWAMAGGPWITPENAMRQLAWSRTDIESDGASQTVSLPLPHEAKDNDWRDWRYIATLAFPTPEGDLNPLRPASVRSSKDDIKWIDYFSGYPSPEIVLPPASKDNPHWIEVSFDQPVVLRTITFPVRHSMHWWYDPAVKVRVQALRPDGSSVDVLDTEFPQSNWMDRHPLSLACNEAGATSTYRIIIDNLRQTTFSSLRLYSAAMKHSYEGEAGWSLRSIDRRRGEPLQSPTAYIDYSKIIDLTASTDTTGKLACTLPKGKWTILRIGHVNSGMRNGPAPPEGTGWECNKLSTEGADVHFAGYIGRLSGKDAPVGNGLLNGMLMDSWECYTQTWTADLEEQFRAIAGYELRRWLPAVFGYVMNDNETTTRFLRDWRAAIGKLFSERFYGRMSALAHNAGLDVQYETSAGDIFPADIMEYYKYADVPMCEFWHPYDDGHSPLRGLEGLMGAINFKPIKPTASAARMYGKPRVAAEAFTSLDLSWDEHLEMLKGMANVNMIDGVTHIVFHTYTHNPQIGFLPPGTSFGYSIGTPFLRGQTWWKYMPEFTTYLARCSYMLERGRPVSDALWYLGDEIDHKPDQNAPFPAGYKYDYCNPDVLMNRLAVRDGQLVTPEGITYRLLWLPQNERMLPETLERILALAKAGATIVGNAPRCIATLSGGKKAQQRFDKAVKALWGEGGKAVRTIGKGKLISGNSIDETLMLLNIQPDVKVVSGSAPLWSHRRVDGADWYFVCAPHGTGKEGIQTHLSFRNNGEVEIWNPVTGEHKEGVFHRKSNRRVEMVFDLPPSGSYFVVFKPSKTTLPDNEVQVTLVSDDTKYVPLDNKWTLTFPTGWGAPASIELDTLKAWKDLNMSAEGRAFSGTAVYTTTFDESQRMPSKIDLGKVEMIASVWLNGKHVRTLWASPYTVELGKYVQAGVNTLRIEVTSSWFNRLVYDASLPEAERKTWTISGPSKDAPLRESGLLGPVKVSRQ